MVLAFRKALKTKRRSNTQPRGHGTRHGTAFTFGASLSGGTKVAVTFDGVVWLVPSSEWM